MPQDVDMPGGFQLVIDAVDPVTGASVANVNVTGVAIFATSLAGLPNFVGVGPFLLVPGPGA
jgi:hypothetical protein